MNRSRKQIKAAKARQAWRKLQEQKQRQEEEISAKAKADEEAKKSKSLRITG